MFNRTLKSLFLISFVFIVYLFIRGFLNDGEYEKQWSF